jgi:poly(3-hydroxybutyrate) depolymerase
MSPLRRLSSAVRVVTMLLAVLGLLSLIAPVYGEYDMLTRYDVPRPEGGRHFWLYSPTQYQHATSPTPLPLAMFFHGYTDVCEQQGYISQFSIWAYVAEVHQYHIAVMCGTNPGPGWNSGSFRGNASGQPDDIAYTRASLAIIQKAVKVREGHVFAMGHSNGAMMYD